MENKGMVAINEDEYSKLIDNFDSELMKLCKIFEKLEIIIDDSKAYMKGDVGSICRTKFNSIKNNFSTIKSNINSYIVDLKKNKSNYQSQDELGASNFKKIE